SKELLCGVLEEADSDNLAETFEARAIGGVRVCTNGDGGDAEDGAKVGGIGEFVEGKIALFLPCHGHDDVVAKEALIGIDEFTAGFWNLVVAIGIDIDHLHGAEYTAGTGSAAGCFEGGFG